MLVVCKGPGWWIKIADLGISKRANEQLTALPTLTGTPAFAAPEILGFIHSNDSSDDSYTNAVDIWSLGVITFLLLTGETLFRDQRRLGLYVAGSCLFPSHLLVSKQVNNEGCVFVKALTAPKPDDCPGAKESLQHPWLDELAEPTAPGTQGGNNPPNLPPKATHDPDPWMPMISSTQDLISAYKSIDISDVVAENAEPEASAGWSTRDLVTAYRPQPAKDLPNKETRATSKTTIASSTPNAKTRIYWSVYRMLRGHTDTVRSVKFSPNGNLVVSTAEDSTVKLWNPVTVAPLRTLQEDGPAFLAVFSPDSSLLLTTSSANISVSDKQNVNIWDPATGRKSCTLQGIEGYEVVFSPDGRLVASKGANDTVKFWDTATGKVQLTLKGHTSLIGDIAIAPNGKLLASGSYDATVKLWDVATGKECGTLRGHQEKIEALAFSPDSTLVATGSADCSVRLWDSATGKLRHELRGHAATIVSVAFSQDGRLLASASGYAKSLGYTTAPGREENTIKLWESATGTLHRTFYGHTLRVISVMFSPDGALIASATEDNTVRVWDSATGAERHSFRGESTEGRSSMTFSPDGGFVESSGNDTIRLWANNAADLEEQARIRQNRSIERTRFAPRYPEGRLSDNFFFE